MSPRVDTVPLRPGPRLSLRAALIGVVAVALLLSTWTAFFDPVRRWKRAIRDDNEGTRRWEAMSGAVMGKVPGVDPALVLEELTAALDDPSFRVRQTAAACLGRLGAKGEGAVPALVEALKDGHPWVRAAAAHALADILEKTPARRDLAVPALVSTLKDRQFDVRMTAAHSLARIGENEFALPVLIEALSRGDQINRSFAIWHIGQAGPGGRSAVPALLKVAAQCATDRDPYMRLRSAEAAEVLYHLGEADAARRILFEAANDEAPMVREEANRIAKSLVPGP